MSFVQRQFEGLLAFDKEEPGQMSNTIGVIMEDYSQQGVHHGLNNLTVLCFHLCSD